MSTTDISIAQEAVSRIGKGTIASLEETSTEASDGTGRRESVIPLLQLELRSPSGPTGRTQATGGYDFREASFS